MIRLLTTAGIALVVLGAGGMAAAQAPVAPRDRAFDPTAQQVPVEHLGQVQPPLNRVGTVPITAGPRSTAPLITIEVSNLAPVPGDRWQLTLMLSNNSPRPLDAQVMCTFRNGERVAADVSVLMRGVGPGDKVSATVAGPRVTTFVDNTPCLVQPPL
jgi:hypothetical protein